MATLQKIRNHGALLIIIVGVAMLAFILGDFLTNSSSLMNRGRDIVGEIAGKKISYSDYEAAQEQVKNVYRIELGRNDFDEELSSQIRNQVWQLMVQDYAITAEAEEIGMTVTPDELKELCFGANPHELIRSRRTFYDPEGHFIAKEIYKQIWLTGIDDAATRERLEYYWMYWENALRLTYLQEKYTNLMQHLITANSLDAKYAYDARQTSVSAEYVMQPYYAVADSLVEVSDRDIKALYKSHKPLYKQTPNRAIAYVMFNIEPSEQDYINAEQMLKNIENEFNTTDNVARVISSANSDIPYYDRDYSINTIPERYKDFAFAKNAKAGDVTGLTFADNTFSMARLMKVGYNLPDSICIKVVANQEGKQDSEDMWYNITDLPKDLLDKALQTKRGERFNYAAGMSEQTIEVVDIAPATPKVKIAILEYSVRPSSTTKTTIYGEATQFAADNTTEDLFRAAAAEKNMTVYPQFNLQKNMDKVGDLKSSRPIVKWAFNANEGEVSTIFDLGDKYVVAVLTEVNDEDYRTLDDVRPELMVEATNNKKAEYIKQQLEGATTLEQAAQILGQPIQSAENVTMSGYQFGNAGYEPAIIGAAFNIAANEVSAPIQGNNGVFVIKTGEKVVAQGEFNAEQEKQQMSARLAYYLPYQAMSLIQEQAEIVDNRANFQ